MASIGSQSTVLPPQGVIVAAEHDGGGTVVWLRGEHDIATVPTLADAIDRAISLDDGNVVVDLSDVEFMGAATVGVLLRARESLRSRSRLLDLRAPSSRAQRVLDLCGVGS